jgi:hypothetical protein
MMSDDAPLFYEQVPGELFRIVPELSIRFRKEFEALYDFTTEDPGHYLLFEDVVFPFVKEIAGDASKERVLKELFTFFERMARSTDPPVLNVFSIGVIEKLVEHMEVLREVERFLGPGTSQMVAKDMKLLKPIITERT